MHFTTRLLILMFFCYAYLPCNAQIHEKVLMCGVCRNVEKRLEKTKKIMESIGALFDDYKILVYENNSTDRTAEILRTWAHQNPRVWLRSETLALAELEKVIVNVYQDGRLYPPEQICRARNVVLDQALDPIYKDFTYLIWMDMDFVRFPDLEGFVDTFQSQQPWDAVFAYGVDPDNLFWDWYALRDAQYSIGSELLGKYWWDLKKTLKLSKQDPWYPVYSAFGGCGIYKKSSIQGCRYSALVTADLEAHVKILLRQQNHPQVQKYLAFNKSIESLHLIEEAKPFLPKILSPNIGIVLHSNPDPVIWRMSSGTHQYPSVCEHVPFHASMIAYGHDKLYINPKLVFRYGD